MSKETIEKFGDWIALNFANGVYLIKDWLILNVGIGVSSQDSLEMDAILDSWITKGIGITLIVFNLVRILKWIMDIKAMKNGKDKIK